MNKMIGSIVMFLLSIIFSLFSLGLLLGDQHFQAGVAMGLALGFLYILIDINKQKTNKEE